MDEAMIRLEDGNYLYLQFGCDNDIYSEDCDAYIDYTLFDNDKCDIDGGQMEYNSSEKNFDDITDAIQDTIAFAYSYAFKDKTVPETYELTDLTLEDGFSGY